MRGARAWVGVVAAAVVGCGSPPPAEDAGADAAAACTRDTECDDGRYCNGAEECAPLSPSADGRGCAPALEPPCLAGQVCDESAETCSTECSVTEDADGDGVRATECGGDDCDDADPERAPGRVEICDTGRHDEDCDDTTFGDRDLDGDGHVDAICCNGDLCGEDCDDVRRGTGPDVPEVCDQLDNDCDGTIDEGVLVPVWPDRDFDLHGDGEATPEMRCPGAFGFATVDDDCDDGEPSIHPAQVEICDGLDNDCDGDRDEAPAAATWYLDEDGDGYGSSDPADSRISCTPLPGYSLRPTDCDDTRGGVSPSTPERCDGLDNDCNGRADFLLGAHDTEDDDGDGHADLACPSGDDCDDRDPTTAPGFTELCDLRDNDCNTMVDDGSAMGSWWPDRDGDTFGDARATPVMSCSFVRGHITRGGDCDDSTGDRRPGASEECDGADEDCDGIVDEGADREPYYLDMDGDGLGAGTPVLACVAPIDRVADASDCDDTSSSVGAARIWFVDADADTYGDPLRSEVACTMPAGRISRGGDCDDSRATVRPMGTEVCGGADEDCDGTVDEDPAAAASCTIMGATPACVAGACAIGACAMGRGDCNASTSDGCEVDLTTMPTSCGMCGRACAAGERCRSGECASVTSLAAGRNFVCALLGTGEIACWGTNTYGTLGRGTAFGTHPPPTGPSQMVQLFTGAVLDDAIAVDASSYGDFACALRAGGTVVCWGHNDEGQIGADFSGSYATRAVTIPTITDATRIAVGANHACAILASGQARCWGDNTSGQLASGSTTPASRPTPVVAVESEMSTTRPIADAIDVSAGISFTCFLHAGGTRVSCAGQHGSGGGWAGQLGRGSIPAGSYPTADDVLLPGGTVLTSIVSGTGSYDGWTCGLRSGDAPLCWGLNGHEQLGAHGSSVTTPRAVEPLLFDQTSAIYAGHGALCVLYDNASFGPRVACMGENASGQLGIDAATGGPIPNDVVTVAGDGTRGFLTDPRQIAIGEGFACALLASGSVTCWGSYVPGTFGDGATTNRRVVQLGSPVPRIP